MLHSILFFYIFVCYIQYYYIQYCFFFLNLFPGILKFWCLVTVTFSFIFFIKVFIEKKILYGCARISFYRMAFQNDEQE